MTVEELMEKLKEMPRQSKVFVRTFDPTHNTFLEDEFFRIRNAEDRDFVFIEY